MDESNLHTYLGMLRRNAWLVAVVALVAAVAAYAVSSAQSERFRSSANLLSNAAASSPGGANEDPVRTLDTLVKLAQTDEVLHAAAVNSGTTVKELRKDTSVSGDPNADILTITATAPTAAGAARRANALALGFVNWQRSRKNTFLKARIEFLQNQLTRLAGKAAPSAVAAASDLRTQLSESQAELKVPAVDLLLVDPAPLPASAYAPKPLRNALIGLFAGILVGLAAAAIRDRLDQRIRSSEELEVLYGAPTLGRLPFLKQAARGDRESAVADFGAFEPLAEAYRTIRTNLSLFRLDSDDAKVIVISSAGVGEGKTSATANLAQALASSGQKVLAISADVHSPMLHRYFETTVRGKLSTQRTIPAPRRVGKGQPAGLVEVLSEQVPLAEALRVFRLVLGIEVKGTVSLLANERRFFDPAVLYQSKAMNKLLERVRGDYDTILIDSPPLLANAEPTLLATHADALVLVARFDKVTRSEARHAVRLLAAANVKPLGLIVLGRADELEVGYGYGYASTHEQPRRRMASALKKLVEKRPVEEPETPSVARTGARRQR